MAKIPQAVVDTATGVWGYARAIGTWLWSGTKAVGAWLWRSTVTAWTSMSPEAKALTKGLAIGFALGAFAVGMIT